MGGFCEWVSEVVGNRLTLPTESQWEYATYGGSDDQEFPWGRMFDISKLWSSSTAKRTCTAAVDRKLFVHRNRYGLKDLSGNVWEWCGDLYSPYGGGTLSKFNAPMHSVDKNYCCRGGSWNNKDRAKFRCANRSWYSSNVRYFLNGFRMVTASS